MSQSMVRQDALARIARARISEIVGQVRQEANAQAVTTAIVTKVLQSLITAAYVQTMTEVLTDEAKRISKVQVD